MKCFFICFLLFLGGCSLKVPSQKISQPQNFHLHIIHVNDTHSHLEPSSLRLKIEGKKRVVPVGGYAALKDYIRKHKSDHTLFLHAGDALQGTLFYTLFKGRADIDALNQLGIDAYVIGNHEFDDGAKNLYENFVSHATFPITSANVRFLDKRLTQRIRPFIIKQFGQEKVAIVGLTVDSTKISKPGKNVLFEDYLKSAKQIVQKLQQQKINKIIFLTHLGIKKDRKLAKFVPQIDLIVGGHSHTLLGDWERIGLHSYGPYPLVVDHNRSKTLIVTSWKWAKVVGDIDLWFDNAGNIIAYKSHPVILSNFDYSPWIKKANLDKNISRLIARYKPEIERLKKRVIGFVAMDLYHVRLPGEQNSEGKRMLYGSMVAPHVARSMMEYLQQKGISVDFSIQNSGGVRISLYKGNLDLEKIYNLLPFGNTLVVVKMKGAAIVEMIRNALHHSFRQGKSGSFPYMYNARIVLDKNRRFVAMEIKQKKWKRIDPSREYTFVTNSFMANGGAYYKALRDAKKYDTGFVDTEAFIDYVKRMKRLEALPPSVVYISGAPR